MSNDTFSDRLRKWRGVIGYNTADFSQAAAAKYLGVSINTYRTWEQGTRHPYGETVLRIIPLLEKKPSAKKKAPASAPLKNKKQQTR